MDFASPISNLYIFNLMFLYLIFFSLTQVSTKESANPVHCDLKAQPRWFLSPTTKAHYFERFSLQFRIYLKIDESFCPRNQIAFNWSFLGSITSFIFQYSKANKSFTIFTSFHESFTLLYFGFENETSYMIFSFSNVQKVVINFHICYFGWNE